MMGLTCGGPGIIYTIQINGRLEVFQFQKFSSKRSIGSIQLETLIQVSFSDVQLECLHSSWQDSGSPFSGLGKDS